MIAISCGCVSEKASLHEDDHQIPEHWPTSLLDSIAKMQERLDRLQDNDVNTVKELKDLVEWVPEVAADSGLEEASWNPIYHLCETLRKHLSAKDTKSEFIREDFARLFEMLRVADREIAERNPPTKPTAEPQPAEPQPAA